MKVKLTDNNFIPITIDENNNANKIIEITEKQFESISFTPSGKRWKYDENTDTFSLITLEKTLDELRHERNWKCFKLIDSKSKFWWESLSESQMLELKNWYKAWLNITETKTEPTKPEWLK